MSARIGKSLGFALGFALGFVYGADPLWPDPFAEDGIHLDFDLGQHYVKAPGQDPVVAAFESLFTFTRAGTNATYIGDDGLLKTAAANIPRIESIGTYTAAGFQRTRRGLLREGARTNQALFARDHTDVAWVKTTMTAALDQIGLDGTANTASSLTATGAAALSLQTIVQAAVLSTFSVDIKRITGTGTIAITQDGVAFTDVTAQINAVSYTRVQLTATQLNPVFGIRLGTNGDKIAVDFSQFEAGAMASSRILTTGATATRNADDAQRIFGSEVSGTVGTIFAEFDSFAATDSNIIASIDDGGTTNQIALINSSLSAVAGLWVRSGGASTVSTLPQSGYAAGPITKVVGAYNGTTDYASSLKGQAPSTAGAGALPVAPTMVRLQNPLAFWNPAYGHIFKLDITPSRLPNAILQAKAA